MVASTLALLRTDSLTTFLIIVPDSDVIPLSWSTCFVFVTTKVVIL